MQIIILCGGIGSRLKTVIKNIPKGMALVHGQPFMNYVFHKLIKNNIFEVILCTGFGHKEYYTEYGDYFGPLKLIYSKDPDGMILGTGGAVLNAINLLEDNFFVQYGDTLLEVDYEEAFNSHLESRKAMTMTVLHKTLTKEKPNIYINSDKTKIRYKKNPSSNEYEYIDYGLLIFNKEYFMKYVKSFCSERKFDLGLLQTKISENDDVNLFFCQEPYFEIGTPSSYEETLKYLEGKKYV